MVDMVKATQHVFHVLNELRDNLYANCGISQGDVIASSLLYTLINANANCSSIEKKWAEDLINKRGVRHIYFDERGNYFCTESNKCPINFNKLIENEDKCIDKCINDDIYLLEYENKCVSECPQFTYNDNNICEIDLKEILENKTNDDRMKSIQNYLENVNPDKIKEKLKNQELFVFRYNEMNTMIRNMMNLNLRIIL